jgi:hypothetical protein
MISGEPTATVAAEAKSGKRKFSPAALKRMMEAQQARWAKVLAKPLSGHPQPKLQSSNGNSVRRQGKYRGGAEEPLGREEGSCEEIVWLR